MTEQPSKHEVRVKPWVVGIDLGATKIRLGLVSPQDAIVAARQIPTNATEGANAVVERIVTEVDALAGDLPSDSRIAAVGICSPGPVDHVSGMLLDPPNLQGLHHTPLRDLLAARLSLPVVIEHDAKAAALGDYYFGAGRGARDMIFIVVGTGVGAAMIFAGKLFRGAHNSAGEIGHTTIDHEGEPCHCGSRGCVETFMSGPSLARHYRQARATAGQPVGEITGGEVAQAAAGGDPVAVEVMQQAGRALGAAVATLAMITDVDLYVIGGSVAKAGDLLLAPAREAAPGYSFASVSSRIRILPTALHDDGPLLGCAWLARQNLPPASA
ncbi:MAG: ROK family protein [Caldilineales bacterium]|nr:ROK family protein [Caldilineales bacterium]MCW5856953.1 ROK family protein [Caldilineales bacterium]